MPGGALLRAAALAAAALAPAPQALAHEALHTLVPLIEVYSATQPSPEFDVAGVRCAALYMAQQDWAKSRPGTPRPSKAQLRDIEANLTAAEQTRRNAGLSLVAAQESIKADVLRVFALYKAHFDRTRHDNKSPWTGDPLLRGDMRYCDLLGGRR